MWQILCGTISVFISCKHTANTLTKHLTMTKMPKLDQDLCLLLLFSILFVKQMNRKRKARERERERIYTNIHICCWNIHPVFCFVFHYANHLMKLNGVRCFRFFVNILFDLSMTYKCYPCMSECGLWIVCVWLTFYAIAHLIDCSMMLYIFCSPFVSIWPFCCCCCRFVVPVLLLLLLLVT